MLTIFNSRGMITILPECSFPVFSLVEFLSGSACNQFDGVGYDLAILVINNEQMDVI